jgi:hypothetical protein
MAATLKIGYIATKRVATGTSGHKQDLPVGDRHAYFDGQEPGHIVTICGKRVVDATELGWPGAGLGSPWCQACIDNSTARPTRG